jgi:Fe-S-cluster containining protein
MAADPASARSKSEGRFRNQDGAFVALIDGAFADAARRSGPHLLCRNGCSKCCIGIFAIGPADAHRLRQGLAALKQEDPALAARIQQRAKASWARLASQFPGDAASGSLHTNSQGELSESFEDFASDEPCPALDPASGSCDLYASRPQTCRVFGPPVATPEGYGICELCFQQATDVEIAEAAIIAPSPELSTALDHAAMAAGERSASTVIAFVLKG